MTDEQVQAFAWFRKSSHGISRAFVHSFTNWLCVTNWKVECNIQMSYHMSYHCFVLFLFQMLQNFSREKKRIENRKYSLVIFCFIFHQVIE